MLRRAHDEGMTLIEVVVAVALFAVMSTAAATVLVAAIGSTEDNKSRLAAIHLASRELEIVRDTFEAASRGPSKVQLNQVVNPDPLVAGGAVGSPLVLNNVSYTVVRTAQWAPVDGAAASTCDEGTSSELAYLRVRVEVSWPNLGDRPPVAMSTLLTPPKGTYSSIAGHIGLKVINRQGAAQSGVLVTATSTSGTVKTGTTGADGCALLAFLDAGTWAVTVSSPGFVNPKGDPTGTTTAQVQAGQLWKGTVEYDRSATIAVTFATDIGYALPVTNNLPVSVANSAIVPTGSRSVAGTGNTRNVVNLWPYASGYQLWAGGCPDNDPKSSGDERDLPVPSQPGGSAAAQVTLGAVKVSGPSNKAVSAVANSCTPTTTVQLGQTDAAGSLKTSLPYGSWRITIGAVSANVTLFKGDPPVTVSVP